MGAAQDRSHLFPATTKMGLVTPTGYRVRQICTLLGVEPADFARFTKRSTESVAKLFGEQPVSPRDEQTVRVLNELIQLVGVLGALDLSPKEIRAWMRTPLPPFEGKPPVQIIEEGDGQQLVARLLAFSSGNVPT
jgi:antitoxin Xre/MbcA/ParS-like protein